MSASPFRPPSVSPERTTQLSAMFRRFADLSGPPGSPAGLWLAQPSLRYGSKVDHVLLAHQPNLRLAYTSFVENNACVFRCGISLRSGVGARGRHVKANTLRWTEVLVSPFARRFQRKGAIQGFIPCLYVRQKQCVVLR